MPSKLRRALKLTLQATIALLLLTSASVAWRLWRAWPRTEGRLTAVGLHAEVEVVRDAWGVAHVYAQDAHDLFFAQGFVHAQDRLWQMHFNRTVSQGLLSSFLGPATLEADRYVRTLGLRRAAEKDLALLDDETRAVLTAYAQGINAFISTHGGRLPIEFTLLQTRPQPWTVLDTLTIGKLMALNLGMNHYFEVARERIRRRAGEAVMRRFVPPYSADGPLILPQPSAPAAGSAPRGALPALLSGPTGGSNAWVVHGSRTASGRPLLVNDTHLTLTMPSIWHEGGLHGGGYDVVGFALPGIPGVVLGHNGRIAWGVSNMCSDLQDLYLEQLDDATRPRRYRFQDAWHDVQVVEEQIPLAGGSHETLELRLTRHGPLIEGLYPDLQGVQALALRWSAHDGGTLAAAVLRLDRARDWTSFRDALRLWDAPTLNFVYADVEGHVGYQAGGRVPARVATHDGSRPVPGWDGASEWRGVIPFDELPSRFDPPQGFVVTANNKVVGDDYPYPIGVDYADPYRARLMSERLAQNAHFGVADARALQAETTSLLAADLRPLLAALSGRDERERQALQLVRAWDLREEKESAAAAIFNAWYASLVSRVAHNVLGEELWKLDKQLYLAFGPMLTALLRQADDPFFDDPRTPAREGRDELLRGALSDALAFLRQKLGDDVARWSWGGVHAAVFAHQPLGASGITALERLFNGRSVPARGGLFTVDNAVPNAEQPFAAFFGASQRLIVDFADLDGSLALNSTGQTEQLFHRNRADQVEAWERVDYHPMPSSRQAVRAAGRHMLTLVPR